MKKFAKTLLTLIGACAMAGTVAGCTNNNSEGKSDSIEVVFWHSFGKTVQDSLAKKISAFEKAIKDNEGVDVTITQTYKGGYTDINSLVNKSFSAGTTPTLTVAYPDHVADYIQSETNPGDHVVKLDDYMNDPVIGLGKETFLGDDLGEEDFVEAYIQEGQNYVHPGTYSLPFMKSTEVMFYNQQMVKKALKGYKPELTSDTQIDNYLSTLTWDEFMNLCNYVNENKASISNALEIPAFYDSDGNCIISYMYQNDIGYSSLSDDGHGVIDFAQGQDRENLKQLLLNFKKWYDQGLFCTKGTYGTYGSNNFVEMKTMFSIGSSGGAGYNFPTADTFTVGVTKVPFMNENPSYVSQGVTLALLKGPQYSSEENNLKTKYGWKFMKYLTNTDFNTEICILGSEGYMPVRESCFETDTFIEFMADEDNDYAKVADVVLNEISGHYYNSAVFPGSTDLRTEVGGMFTDVLLLDHADDATLLTQIDGLITRAVNNATLSIK